MPAFRNVANRQSGRLSKSTPVIYGEDGWPDFEATVSSTLACLDVKPAQIKVEQDDQPLSPVSTLSSSSPSSSASPSFSVEPSSTSPPPSRKNSNSHSRRRDPSHIPRPRNAFILFRSDYIKRESAQGLADGQQNELSKLAGKVWTKMSAQDKQPYAERAMLEKEEHYKKYPNYVYAPGRNGSNLKARPVKRKSGASAGRGPARKRKPSLVSDEEDSSVPPSPVMSPIPARSQKIPRVAAQRAALKITQLPSPSPSASIQHSPMSDAFSLEDSEQGKAAFASPHPDFSCGDSDYVPTSEIPELRLSPPEYAHPAEYMDIYSSFSTHQYDSLLDSIPNHYGLRCSFQDPTLPPLPQGTIVFDEYSEFLDPQSQEHNKHGVVEDIFGYLSATSIGTEASASQKDSKTSTTTTTVTNMTTTTTITSSSSAAAASSSSSAHVLPDVDPLFKCYSDPPELFPDYTYPYLETDPNAGVYQFFDDRGNHLY